MKWFKIEDYKTSQILLVIVIIIMVLPFFLNLPAVNKHFDFSKSGQIGDTIGGVTAPFINGLAAILVFIAFKAQIKANEIFKSQERTRIILEQIALIQEDKLDVIPIIVSLTRGSMQHIKTSLQDYMLIAMNKIIYFTTEVHLAYELIEEFEGEKNFLYRKLYYLYVTRYKESLSSLKIELAKIDSVHNDYQKYVTELCSDIDYLNNNLADVNKYGKKQK